MYPCGDLTVPFNCRIWPLTLPQFSRTSWYLSIISLFCVSFCLRLLQTLRFCTPVSTATIPFIFTVWAQRAPDVIQLVRLCSLELPKSPKCSRICVCLFVFFCWPSVPELVQSQRERSRKERIKQRLGDINGVRPHAFIQRAEVSLRCLSTFPKPKEKPLQARIFLFLPPCCITVGDLFKWWYLLKAEGRHRGEARNATPVEASRTNTHRERLCEAACRTLGIGCCMCHRLRMWLHVCFEDSGTSRTGHISRVHHLDNLWIFILNVAFRNQDVPVLR